MKDLSRHILGLIEDAIQACATMVSVTLIQNSDKRELTIIVDDNGGFDSGDRPAAEELSRRAESEGGTFALGGSVLGGISIATGMPVTDEICGAVGELPKSLASAVCANRGLELWFRMRIDERQCVLPLSKMASELPENEAIGLAAVKAVAGKIEESIINLSFLDREIGESSGQRLA